MAKPEPKIAAARAPLELTPDPGTQAARPARVLCVDDEPAVLTILSRALGSRFEIVTMDDPVAALALLERGADFSVVISDLKMPQMDGAEFLERVKRLAPSSSRLALTGSLDRELQADAVFGVLTKPCPIRLLHESVTAAVQHHLLLTHPETVLPMQMPINVMSTAPPDHDDMESGIRARRARTGLGAPGAIVAPGSIVAPGALALPGTLALPASPLAPRPGSLLDPGPPEPEAPYGGGSRLMRAVDVALPPEEAAGGLAILSAVANKFFLLGHATEAERILRAPLEDVLTRARAGRYPQPKDAKTAAILALQLAEQKRDTGWMDYAFRLYRALRKPLPSEAIERLYVLIRQLPGGDRVVFREYLDVLRNLAMPGPSDQFLIRRIEGLEPMFRS